MGFLEQFLDVFGELKGKDFYVSGESVSLNFREEPQLMIFVIILVCWLL